MPGPALHALTLAADPAAWRALGFAVHGSAARVGATALLFEPDSPGRGITAWTLRDAAGDGEVDGLATERTTEAPGATGDHPNGASRLDHVVVITPDLERTTGALGRLGLERRRVREAGTPQAPVRQGFFRLGEVILEVVEPGGESAPEAAEPARFWGVVAVVEDLDACAALLGDRLGPARDAVQPGRRIATVRREAGAGVALAFMTPEPPRG